MSNLHPRLKAGAQFLTTGGLQARIYAIDGCGTFMVHGAINRPGVGWCSMTWNAEGRANTEAECDEDLCLPAAGVPNEEFWDWLPEEFNALNWSHNQPAPGWYVSNRRGLESKLLLSVVMRFHLSDPAKDKQFERPA